MKVQTYQTRADMGRAAADDVAVALRSLLATQQNARMIFAAAPSQSDMLQALREEPGIDWNRVTAFHMDEYIGLPEKAPQRFALWLREHLFDRLPFGAVHLIDPGQDPEQAISDYAALLDAAPIDMVCMGIGVNGHIAFNDPPVANFDDPLDVKIVELDDVCRQQQVDDACFESLDAVPEQAVTLTIPRLLRAGKIVCVVPGQAKREAVRQTLYGPVSTACPATALRGHADTTLYLDADSTPPKQD